jgi:CDP-diacylglycerol--serine O-phosphatidyltransferase
MTVLAICLGLTSVKFALDGQTTFAMAFLVLAAILDALDGRIARALGATSKMGEEIDSLADAVNFGVAPAFIVYATLLKDSQLGWTVVLLYAVCIVLRLARFNTLIDVDQPAFEKEYFVGMPAPAGALCAIGPIAAKLQFHDAWWSSKWADLAVIVWMVGVSVLVVSRIPMRKVHTFSVPPKWWGAALALLVVFTAASFAYPYWVIMVIVVGYICHIPFAIRSKRWTVAHPEAWESAPRQRRAQRRAIRRAHPHRRSMARLGLRRPQRR